jgi:hypothetical protein
MNRIIRPLSIWQIINRSLRLYRAHFWAFLGMSLLVGLAGYAINGVFLYSVQWYLADIQTDVMGRAEVIPLVFFTLATIALGFAVLFVEIGVLASVVTDSYLEGECKPADSLRRLPVTVLAGTAVLATLIVMGGFCLLIIPGMLCLIAFVLAPVIVGAEDLKPTAVLKRSWSLVRKGMPGGLLRSTVVRISIIWAFIGILNLLGLAVVLSVTRAAPDRWKTYRTISSQGLRWELPIPSFQPRVQVGLDLFSEFIQAFLRPFAVCALVMLYYDVRLRQEGLDIRWLLRQSAGPTGESSPDKEEE